MSYEKDDYIINGKVDLLLGKDDKLEVLDFKSQPRPVKNDAILEKYRYQLHVYAHILKERYQKTLKDYTFTGLPKNAVKMPLWKLTMMKTG